MARTARRRLVFHALCLLLLGQLLLGCRSWRGASLNRNKAPLEVSNPLPISQMDRWFVMEQVSDALDDYFRIYREERIRLVDNVITEGWIETHPKIGGTILEPWHKDSTRGFEKLHASLQTVRRFSKVRVIPVGNGYQIDVKVFKELEDLPEPQHSTVTGRVLRHDSSLDVDFPDEITSSSVDPANKGWIPMGRDFTLEQEILRDIQARLATPPTGF